MVSALVDGLAERLTLFDGGLESCSAVIRRSVKYINHIYYRADFNVVKLGFILYIQGVEASNLVDIPTTLGKLKIFSF